MTTHRDKIGNSRVLESRESADGVTIRRRRETPDGHRFTTYERIEYPTIAVLKRTGSRELFDRTKLRASVRRSVGKFFKSELELEDRIHDAGENEIESRVIGGFVLDELAARNEVAYVRFASVFYKFKTLDDFVKILEQRRSAKQQEKQR